MITFIVALLIGAVAGYSFRGSIHADIAKVAAYVKADEAKVIAKL